MRPLRTVIAVEGSTDETFFRSLLDRALQQIGQSHPGRGFDVAQPVVLRRTEDTWRTLCRELVEQEPRSGLAFFHYDGTSRPEREAKKSWQPMLGESGPELGESAAAGKCTTIRRSSPSSWTLPDWRKSRLFAPGRARRCPPCARPDLSNE